MSLPSRISPALDEFPYGGVQRDFDNLMRGFFNGRTNGSLANYAVDVREDADHIYVEAEMPGFKKEEVDITLENSTLTISAERRSEQKPENSGDYLLNERRYTRYLRSFALPPTVDEKTVQANLKEGVLTITLNKSEASKPRKVQVS
ncbi:MAG TPA: Hsp20/alpha crystallin family protein [Tepidisphaeraceae bacterium]|nr:Hsp20/alpha crystallin family protein [Tepidisphaeraceae bacterium]